MQGEEMPKISIIVEFDVLPGRQEEFEAAIRKHASTCLAEEAGCLRFEVHHPLGENGAPAPNKLLVNELFSDDAAVQEHRNTPRMKKLESEFDSYVSNRRAILCSVEN